MKRSAWRPILFFVFMIGFLLSAPVVVFYTAGYRYQVGSGKIVQTGVLNINSIPKNALVFVDDVLQKEHTPAVIDTILPGKHDIHVTKEGYTSWYKTMEVISRQGTLAQEVILYLTQEPDWQSLDAPLPIKPVVTPKWQATTLDIHVQNTTDRTIVSKIDNKGIATIIAYLPLSTYSIQSAPAPYTLLYDDVRGRVVLIHLFETNQPILLNADATLWNWSAHGDALLLSDGFDVEVYTPSTHERETITRLSQPVSGLQWYPLGRQVFFLNGGQVYAHELDWNGQPNQIRLMEGYDVKTFWFEDDGNWMVGVANTEEGERGFRKRLQK